MGRGGIRQGGPLSPCLFVWATAVLIILLSALKHPPEQFVYADDAMLWILGNPIEVQRRLGKVLAKIKEIGIISGLVLNLEKSFALARKIPGTRIGGLQVVPHTRWPGILFGHVRPSEAYPKPIMKAQARVHVPARMALTL